MTLAVNSICLARVEAQKPAAHAEHEAKSMLRKLQACMKQAIERSEIKNKNFGGKAAMVCHNLIKILKL